MRRKASPSGGGAPGGGGEGRKPTALSVTACGRASSPIGGARIVRRRYIGCAPPLAQKKINEGVAFVDENPALPWGSIITCTTRQVDRLSMASLLPTSNRMLHRPGGLQFTTEYGIPY